MEMESFAMAASTKERARARAGASERGAKARVAKEVVERGVGVEKIHPKCRTP